ncbi:hypothetical protein EJB05_24128, partial [Eragrostis curvula]
VKWTLAIGSCSVDDYATAWVGWASAAADFPTRTGEPACAYNIDAYICI